MHIKLEMSHGTFITPELFFERFKSVRFLNAVMNPYKQVSLLYSNLIYSVKQQNPQWKCSVFTIVLLLSIPTTPGNSISVEYSMSNGFAHV